MSTSENKALVREFWNLFAADIEGALAMVSDDAIWKLGQVNGGEFDKPTIRKVLDAVTSQFVSPGSFTIQTILAEDALVCVEIQGSAELVGGKRYDNKYCMIFTIRDRKIARIHEYTDTFYAMQTLSLDGLQEHLAA